MAGKRFTVRTIGDVVPFKVPGRDEVFVRDDGTLFTVPPQNLSRVDYRNPTAELVHTKGMRLALERIATPLSLCEFVGGHVEFKQRNPLPYVSIYAGTKCRGGCRTHKAT